MIRSAEDGDLAAIAAILNSNIAESPYVYAEAPVTLDERRVWLSEHRAASLPVIVAMSHGDVVGWGALTQYRSSSGYRYTAEASVYVAESAQRRGFGGRLLAQLLDRARSMDLRVILASIDADNAPSIALFERYEFVERARLLDVGRKFGEWRTQLLLHRYVDRVTA